MRLKKFVMNVVEDGVSYITYGYGTDEAALRRTLKKTNPLMTVKTCDEQPEWLQSRASGCAWRVVG